MLAPTSEARQSVRRAPATCIRGTARFESGKN